MKLLISMVVVSLLLAGCESLPKLPPKAIYTPSRVEIPIPVACIKVSDIPVEPVYELDSLDPEADLYAKILAAFKEIEQRKEWQRKAKSIMFSCSTIN